jgi:hypothetical protein
MFAYDGSNYRKWSPTSLSIALADMKGVRQLDMTLDLKKYGNHKVAEHLKIFPLWVVSFTSLRCFNLVILEERYGRGDFTDLTVEVEAIRAQAGKVLGVWPSFNQSIRGRVMEPYWYTRTLGWSWNALNGECMDWSKVVEEQDWTIECFDNYMEATKESEGV